MKLMSVVSKGRKYVQIDISGYSSYEDLRDIERSFKEKCLEQINKGNKTIVVLDQNSLSEYGKKVLKSDGPAAVHEYFIARSWIFARLAHKVVFRYEDVDYLLKDH